ncbi:MAG: hypothetical protein ACTSXL_04840 [Alphaproteobacteria bacterium]|nr:MAG: hypothetical protein B6I23_00340 [Rickettsiaceae bacterium 4572_127]
MQIKKRIIDFFRNDFRTKNGAIFSIAIFLSFYFCLQLMFGRSNLFYLMRLKSENQKQEIKLEKLKKETLLLQMKTNLVLNKSKDFIDELLIKKLNRFQENTYQIKENN